MAHVRKNALSSSRPFVADFTDDDGNRRQLSFATEKQAKKVVQAAKQREQGRLQFVTFTGWYIADLEARGISSRTLDNIAAINRQHWLPTFGDRTLGELAVAEWRQFRADLAVKGLSPAWIRTICLATSHMYSRAVEAGLVETNPLIQANKSMRKYYAPAPISYPTASEAARILEASEGQVRLCIMLVVQAGLRVSEAASLRWSDVDSDGGTISVTKVRVLGGERELPASSHREVPLHPDLVSALAEARSGNASPYMFKGGRHNCGSGPPGTGYFHGRIRKLMFDTGLTRVLPDKRVVALYGADELRHLAALAWKRDGMSVRRIAKLMGFKRVMTIQQRYRGHFRDKRDRGFVASAAALIFKKRA